VVCHRWRLPSAILALGRIMHLARRLAPAAFILVRRRHLRAVEPLSQLGADEEIADELAESIEVFPECSPG
jgi:hypothetical protein